MLLLFPCCSWRTEVEGKAKWAHGRSEIHTREVPIHSLVSHQLPQTCTRLRCQSRNQYSDRDPGLMYWKQNPYYTWKHNKRHVNLLPRLVFVWKRSHHYSFPIRIILLAYCQKAIQIQKRRKVQLHCEATEHTINALLMLSWCTEPALDGPRSIHTVHSLHYKSRCFQLCFVSLGTVNRGNSICSPQTR